MEDVPFPLCRRPRQGAEAGGIETGPRGAHQSAPREVGMPGERAGRPGAAGGFQAGDGSVSIDDEDRLARADPIEEFAEMIPRIRNISLMHNANIAIS